MNRSWNWCSVQLLTVRRGKAPCIETPMSERAISRRIDDKLIRVLREKRKRFFPPPFAVSQCGEKARDAMRVACAIYSIQH